MTRTDLFNAVARDFGYVDVASSPASAITNRIYAYLNDRHRRILVRPGLEKLRMQTTTITLTASTAVYGLDLPIQKLLKVTDTTNDQPLEQRTLDWYRRVDPDPQTGTQEYWIPLRWGPALRAIGGTGLWVVSTSTSDAGGSAVTVNVETIDSNGSHTQTTASTNGTTRVAIGSATNHQRLLRFSASAAAVGVLELYDAASSGNKVSAIQLGRTSAQLLTIALWPTPAAADTLQLDFVHYIRDFSVAYDEPQLPYDFHYLVAVGAKIDEARKKDDARARQWQEEWDEGIGQLEGWVNNFTDTLIIPGLPDRTGRSNLGSAYPSGIWAALLAVGLLVANAI